MPGPGYKLLYNLQTQMKRQAYVEEASKIQAARRHPLPHKHKNQTVGL